MNLQLKQIRKESRISQEELAKLIGVSARAIGAWERGENSPNAEQVWNCALALHSTPNDLLGWYIDHPSARQQPERLDGERAELLRCYDRCTPQWREQVLMSARASALASGEAAERDAPAAVEA